MKPHQRLDDMDGKLKSIAALRGEYTKQAKHKKRGDLLPGPGPELEHGWLFKYLIVADAATWQRWTYWMYLSLNEWHLPPEPIPYVEFTNAYPQSKAWPVRQMLERCLNAISPYGDWEGWSTWDYFDFFLSWLLYAFGSPTQTELPKEPSEGASYRLFQTFDLDPIVLWPSDYWGDLFAESRVGRGQGFYPTPLNITQMMADMLAIDASDTGHFVYPEPDRRLMSVNEPCVGTGAMLLAASNYHLSLSGQDINPLTIKACLVNLYLYAPWGAKPIPWVEEAIKQRGRFNAMMQLLQLPDGKSEAVQESPVQESLAATLPDMPEPAPRAHSARRKAKAKITLPTAEQVGLFS
jgi:hypothetical protein